MLRRLIGLACLSLAAAGLYAHFSAAAFTAASTFPANGVTVDALRNYFSVTPINATVASGDVDSFSLDFGTVASARTFASVFRIKNVSGSTQTANLTLADVPQIASVAPASVTLAPGAAATVNVTTSSTVAGRGVGTLQLALSGSSWLYRTYSVRIDEAPEAPGAPTVVQRPAGRLDLSWTASTTVTNLAGYDVYRSSGGAYTKLNASPLTATTYNDTATVDGTAYTYKVRAVSSGVPVLESVDSPTAAATADATAPGQPTAISLANGGGAGNAYVNSGNASNLSVSVTLPGGSLATDSVQLTVSNGGNSVTATHAGSAGAGTVTFSGLNASGLGDGTLTFSARSTDAAGNVSGTATATAPKDTTAPAAPSATYTDNRNAADVISGTAEANAVITAGSYSTTADASGAYSLAVAATNGKTNAPITVTYAVTARDAAGNTSPATTITFSDTR